MALKKGKIITITSVKGGTGKSTITMNMAGILSTMKLKTIIVDLDLYSGVIAASLNLDSNTDIYTLVDDVMNNRFDQTSDYTKSYNEYIDVLPAPIDPRSVGKIGAKYIDIILARLALKYDVILIDTNHIIDQINLVSLDLSDEVLYVMTNDLMDLKNMKTMSSIYKDMDKTNYKIILNEARPNNTSHTLYDIKNIIGSNVDYIIPKQFYNKNIDKYVYNGKIMVLDKSFANNKGTIQLKTIINDILKG